MISILICTYGDKRWEELAYSRAYPSTINQAGDPQVVMCHLENGTLAESRNMATARAIRPWLCFLDADDELCPGYTEAMIAAISRENAEPVLDGTVPMFAPAVSYCNPQGGTPARIPNAGKWPDLNECVIGTLVSYRMFQHVGGFRELPSLEDYDLWLRCYLAGGRIVHVPDAVYCAHQDVGGRNHDQSIYPELRLEHAAAWERR